MKRCSRCGETKPLDEFTRDSRRRDGRHNQCRLCKRLTVAESRRRRGGDRERARSAAAGRAAALFRERFPDEWQDLLADEEAKRGIVRDLWERTS